MAILTTRDDTEGISRICKVFTNTPPVKNQKKYELMIVEFNNHIESDVDRTKVGFSTKKEARSYLKDNFWMVTRKGEF